MDAAASEQERYWQRVEAAIGPARYAALVSDHDLDAFVAAIQQVLDADPDLAAAGQRLDRTAWARFLAIYHHAPTLPGDVGMVHLFTTKPDARVEAGEG